MAAMLFRVQGRSVGGDWCDVIGSLWCHADRPGVVHRAWGVVDDRWVRKNWAGLSWRADCVLTCEQSKAVMN
jgi:hypothetical protein